MHPDRASGRIPDPHKTRTNPSVPDFTANGGTLPRATAADPCRIGFSFFLRPRRQPISMNFGSRAITPESLQRMGAMFPCFHPPSPAPALQPDPQTPHLAVSRHKFIKVSCSNLGQNVSLENSKKALLGESLNFQIPAPFVSGNPFSVPLVSDRGNQSVSPPPQGADPTMEGKIGKHVLFFRTRLHSL